MKKRLIRVREEDAAALAVLGKEIWEEHYTSILGPEQVAYMVREFQSEPAVLRQMREELPARLDSDGFLRKRRAGRDQFREERAAVVKELERMAAEIDSAGSGA